MAEIRQIAPTVEALSEVIDVIRYSHEDEYRKTGLIINTTKMKPSELCEQLTDQDGICLVMIEEGKVIGTASLFTISQRKWYSGRSRAVKAIKYVAVLPEHQGKHIASGLLAEIQRLARKDNFDLIVSTDTKNEHAIHLYQKNGFLAVDYSRGNGAKSNAIRLMWWRMGCPFSFARIKIYLIVQKIKCRLKSLLFLVVS